MATTFKIDLSDYTPTRNFEERIELECQVGLLEDKVADLGEEKAELLKRLQSAEQERDAAIRAAQTLELRLEQWKVPPPCRCGGFSFRVECPSCHRSFDDRRGWHGDLS